MKKAAVKDRPGTIGLGEAAQKHPGIMSAATTFWRPLSLIVELAFDTQGRGEYAYTSRRMGLKESGEPKQLISDPSNPLCAHGFGSFNPDGGALLRYTWCTPDFVAGMSQVAPLSRDEWVDISSQNRWNGVVFAGNSTARIFTQPLMPAKGSVYNAEWGVQNKGVMILQRLRTSNAQGQRIWFDKSLKRIETNEWIFVEAPQAYAAVRIAKGGGRWESDTIKQRRDGKGGTDVGEWLALNNEISPVVIEVARKCNYSDFSAFQRTILANPFKWEGKTVEYHSVFYKTTLALPVDASGLPLIDGVPINFEPQKCYDSPYLQGIFGDGMVTVQKGETVQELDFTGNKQQKK